MAAAGQSQQELNKELVTLNNDLEKSPEDFEKLYRMSEVMMGLEKTEKASQFIIKAIGSFFKAPGPPQRGIDVCDLALKHWRTTRYANKETLRINLSEDRAKQYSNVLKLLKKIQKELRDESLKNAIAFRTATIQENVGMIQDALQIYSDLIAAQAMDTGVDLTFVIMKASILLKHVGNHAQAVEYLEFLLDEPPEAEGYGRTHILAFLALTYEHHPKRQEFATTLKKTYEDLFESYAKDLSKGNKPQTNARMLDKMLQDKTMGQSSEVWEMLSLQVIDRCEHVLAFELMSQAVEKAPTKHKSLYLLAEVCYQLNYIERAALFAERAFDIQPQNVELRGFLLLVAPEKWQDKLRNVATTKVIRKGGPSSSAGSGLKVVRVGEDEEPDDEGMLAKMSGGAAAAFTAIKNGGLSPEQAEKKAKQQAAREKRRKEKHARREKKAALQKMEEEKVVVKKRTPGKPRDPSVDGPARPEKPQITQETLRLLEIAREGKNNIHYYDRTMMTWAHARVDIERGERQLVASMRNGGKAFDDKPDKGGGDKEESEDEELSD